MNACFALTEAGGITLLDCGATALVAMRRWGVDPDRIGTIAISHLHGDHFGGLVFLLREATLFRRPRRDLILAGPPSLQLRLEAAMEAFFPGGWAAQRQFDLRFVILQPGETTHLPGLSIRPVKAFHTRGTEALALRLDLAGRSIGYTGDSEWVDGLLEIGRDADLLIAEAWMPGTATPRHMALGALQQRLSLMRPKRVLLTHLGTALLADRAAIPEPVAEDGLELSL
ncbi:MBL fold metallo-hydrolase [Rhodovarius lipocyclicus]|uniref:MBL fold metallo-hydrolase n=1 Tax=Rhodovarius lipocyclicus TaxID=268410 RepID=UPI0019179120|nr:MBL fold metallo-hydrolase [Rhodovarius lipocyclicus]